MMKKWILVIPLLACIALAYCGVPQNSQRSAKISDVTESSEAAEGNAFIKNNEEEDGSMTESGDAEKNSISAAGMLNLPEAAEESSEGLSEEMVSVPALPETGGSLAAFVPLGWELKDSVSFDYNGDGIMDFAAVLEYVKESDAGVFYRLSPRILFAVYGEEQGSYRLDFQDMNLVRARSEGGVFGDPYEPLTAEGSSFTIHSYGGSAWRWSEARTFTWREGTWYLTLDESSYGYGFYVTHYSSADYDGGTVLHQRRSDEFSDMEKVWETVEAEDMDGEEIPFDLTYEIPLGEPPTLEQAGMRWWLAPDRMTEKPVDEIVLAEDVKLSSGQVKLPDDVLLFDDQDENSLLYSFCDEDSGQCYIALYQMDERKLSVMTAADQEHFSDVAGLYQGKIYFILEARESDIAWKEQEMNRKEFGQEQQNVREQADLQEPESAWKQAGGQDREAAGGSGEEKNAARDDKVIGLDLYRMDPDGKNRQPVFGWLLAEEERENPPYLSMACEFGKDEMVVKIYRGDGPHPFYRMTPKGQEIRFLGQVPNS